MADDPAGGWDPLTRHRENALHLCGNDIVVAGDPGAGNALVGNIVLELGLDYLDPYTEDVGDDGSVTAVESQQAYRRRMAASAALDPDRPAGDGTARFVKTHMYPEHFDCESLGGALVLVRDPRDTIYSGFRWFESFSRSWWDDEDVTAGKRTFADYLDARRIGDGRDPVTGWTEFYEHWLGAAPTMRRCAVVRFEDLKAEPVATVTAMLAAFGIARSAEEIERAVRASSFEAMRAHEDAATAGESDSARIMRRGAVGEWQEWIDRPGVAEKFDSPALAATAARFGFRIDDQQNRAAPRIEETTR